MSHVADSPINRLFDRFFGAFYPYPANKSALRCGRDHPPSGIRETWLAPNVHLATVLPASRPALHARPAGSGHAQTLPRWLLPDTDTRVGKDRTRPDLHERPVFIQRADKELKAPPALEGSAMVARPTRLQIFEVN